MFNPIKYIKQLFGNTLYYPGCLTKYVLKDIGSNYMAILKSANVNYIMIDKEFCCGSPIINAGYYKDFDKLADDNISVFKKYGVSKILFNCPSCYYTFSKLYDNKLNDFSLEHMSTFILDLIERKKLKLMKVKMDAVYHDPCHLGRSCDMYDEPRALLRVIGVNVVELDRTKEDTRCCGGGGGLRNFDNDTSQNITKLTLDEINSKNIKYLITTCSMCYLQFKTVAEKYKYDIKIIELSQLIMELLKNESDVQSEETKIVFGLEKIKSDVPKTSLNKLQIEPEVTTDNNNNNNNNHNNNNVQNKIKDSKDQLNIEIKEIAPDFESVIVEELQKDETQNAKEKQISKRLQNKNSKISKKVIKTEKEKKMNELVEKYKTYDC